ncbi:PLD nuclease N-terminal domain-containing protein [Salegentibacter sp. JZCK2]|uniref:PLD nuclease N-terminal domain-containing protein n=1 Tax=Salegentibacter tibetensis TaxID=2873600 RepID=UPI001CCC9633|nr:PLD nuclease N-terminal domain-containing protein [Salegentibacter tibetensis]MBZ9729782.1 PLD nuclease N-terminal domain-containing protein [Salegentibacter tibetensis]
MIQLETSSFWLSAFMVALIVLPVLAFASLLRENLKGRHRLIWVLIIVFLPFFGPILYFLIIKEYKKVNLIKRKLRHYRQRP